MALRTMAERYERPDWVRRVNAMGLATAGPSDVVPMEADELLDTAGIEGGVNLGDGDWEPRFRRLVDAVNASDLHVVGRLLTREELLRCLRTRQRMETARAAAPSIADEVVDAPLVVTGPARSGTTITFELLGLDPRLQTPVAADVIQVASTLSDPDRFLATECEQELWADVQPEFATVHELRADLPVECITFTAPSFAGNHWAMVLGDQGDWAPDPAADFAFHRALLQTVQHGREPRTWLIKTPAYLMMLDELLTAYPGASVVMTHRDPAKTMPSTVSTTALVQWLRTDAVDLELLSPLIGALFADALATVATRRAEGSIPAACGDVRFTDLVRQPVEAIAGACEMIGRELTDEHAAAIDTYVRDKPKGKFGTHHYTAEDWGFDPPALHEQLAEYVEYFGIELET